jgi:hypothetical protein
VLNVAQGRTECAPAVPARLCKTQTLFMNEQEMIGHESLFFGANTFFCRFTGKNVVYE